MADKLQLLVEANERGLLKGNHKAMYDEAVSRGLIKPSQPEAEGGLSAAFGAGVDKVQELGYRAVKGFTDVGVPEEEQTDAIGKAIGQGGSLSQWAQKGIDRNVEEQKAYKPTVGSYKDISGLSDLGSYTGELVAGSLPYMAGAATGVGAFGMAGGLSNEAYEKQPEGEKDEVKAVASGAGQMLLERLGIKVSMGQLGKDILKDGVVETAKRMGRGELVEAVRDPSFAKRILKGAGAEGLTETGQEALAQWGAGKSIDEFEGLDEAFVGGVLVGGVMRTGSETAQKAMGYQQKSAETVKNGADQLVEAGATPEEAIETVKKQQYDSAIKQGFTEVEASAIVARTMKEKFGIDDPVFAAAAEPVQPETQAQTIPEDTETPVFKNDDIDYDSPTAARQAGFDPSDKGAGNYGDSLVGPLSKTLGDMDAIANQGEPKPAEANAPENTDKQSSINESMKTVKDRANTKAFLEAEKRKLEATKDPALSEEKKVNVPIYTDNGEPFISKRDALLSKEARAARRAGHKTKAVSFDNGFGWTIKGDDGTKQDSEQAAAEQSPKSDTVAQNEQGDQAQPAKQEGEALSLNVDAAPSKDEEDDKNIAVNDKVNGVEVIDTPVSELSLSKDIPQFKSGSNVDGVVEPLTGKFDPIGMSPVQVWVRNGGNKEIITGRHRFDLAKRDGIENIPAQYHYESEGFTADDGKRLDAILNIREDKGQVEDYVELFKQDGITESEAKQYGLLDRATGRTAFKIANSATNETIEAQRTGRISAQAAEAIADAAPGNERLQVLGIKSIADDQRSITFAKNLIHAVSALDTNQDQGGESGDLFGFDDSAMQEAEQMAKEAATKQREIRNRLSAIRGAANKPEIAKAEGVNVKNPKALKKRTDELANEVKAWDNWHTSPEMVQQIRDSISAPNTETSAPNTAPITETVAEPEATEQDSGPDLFGDSEPPLIEQDSAIEDSSTNTKKRKVYGWDRVELSKNYTANELDEWIKELSNDPDNQVKDGIYQLDAKTRKKIDELTWAVYYIQKEQKGEERQGNDTSSSGQAAVKQTPPEVLNDTTDAVEDTPPWDTEEDVSKPVKSEKSLPHFTRKDKKGNTYTYYENTETKDGVEVTSFTFNKSNKNKDARSNTSLDSNIIFNEKGYEVDPDSIPDDMEVTKVYEIRKKGNKIGATVKMENKSEKNWIEADVILIEVKQNAKQVLQETAETGKLIEQEPATTDQQAELPPILKTTKRKWLQSQAKEQGLKKGSPGFDVAMAKIEEGYEPAIDKALAESSFETYQEFNSDTPESINRQAYSELRKEFGIDDTLQAEKPAQQIRDSISAPKDGKSAPSTAPITETEAEPESTEQNNGPDMFGDSEPPLFNQDPTAQSNNPEIPDSSNQQIKKTEPPKSGFSLPESKRTGQLNSDTIPAENSQATVKQPSNKKEQASQQESIDDFGEKLGGARKDVWGGFSEAIQDQKSTTELPLSKAWPEPNYKELVEKGANAESAALIAAMRSEIPSKPRVARKVARWAEKVNTLKSFAADLMNGDRNVASVMQRMRNHSSKLAAVVDAIPSIAKADIDTLKNVADYRISSGSFSIFGGKTYSPSKVFYFIERNGRPVYDGASETLSDVQALLTKVIKAEQTDNANATSGKKSKISVYRDRYTKDIYLGWKGAGGVLKIKSFDDLGAARDYLKNNREEVEQTLQKIKETPSMRKPVNAERIGPERYAENVTPDTFGETFGFRGVEFGNWVEQAKRQKNLNQAYDGLMDLAEALDLPPKALSLNGKLGLAFGARGKGGKNPAAAHYEPNSVVINLTKKAGAGSLAHEWWHALDNYFGKQRPNTEFITESPYTLSTDEIRPEMANAFKHIRNAIVQSGLPERSKQLDTRRSKAYWATTIEMTARSFETYIIDKLNQQGITNDYLANVVSDEAWTAAESLGFESDNTYPYPNKEEQEKINPAYQTLFDTVESENTSEGIRLFSKSKKPASSKSISTEQAQRIADQFVKDLKGANGITVSILDDTATAEKLWRMSLEGATVKGAYSEMSNTVYIIAENMDSIEDLKQTLAHETIAHGGLDTVIGKEAKQEFIDRIKKTKGRKAFEKYWKDANNDYWDASEDVKAEEIFARFVENEPTKGELKYWWQALKRFIRAQLDKVGLAYSEDTELTAMREMLESIVKGFKAQREPMVSSQAEITYSQSDKKFSRTANNDTSPAPNKIAGSVKKAFTRDRFEKSSVPEWEALNAQLRETDKTAGEKIKRQLSRWFMPGGNLPETVQQAKRGRDRDVAVHEFDVSMLVGKLNSAMKAAKINPDRLTDAQWSKYHEFLTGENDGKALNQSERDTLILMREHIDGLTKDYVASVNNKLHQRFAEDGTIDPKESARLEKMLGNMGKYLNRSYKAFDDPKWFEKIPTKVIDDARAYLMKQYEKDGATAKEAQQKAQVTMNEMVKTGTAYDSLGSFIAESKLGSKDLSTLIPRKDIAPEIRALLGEYADPRINYAKSVSKMSAMIANDKLLSTIRDMGINNFIFEKDSRPPNATVQLAGEASEVYAPLNGMWTTPEIKEAFEDAMGGERGEGWLDKAIQINGFIKFGKTVLSPTTAMRNVMSAYFFTVANGHFNQKYMKQAVAAFNAQVKEKVTDGESDYIKRLIKLGVLYDSANAGDIVKVMTDGKINQMLEGRSGAAFENLRWLTAKATGFYRFGDDFWKIVGFENEKAALVRTGMKESEAESLAAERIQNTYPTYSRVGKAGAWLSRFPLAGTFVSFPAEVIRTTGNMMKLAASEIKSDNPKIRAMGAKRIVGMSLASGGMFALSALSAAMFGVTDDEEEALRDLAPPWQKNSTFVYAGRDSDNNLRYFDMSFLDPYAYWKRPIEAMMRDQPVNEAIASSLSDMVSPFLGTDISTGKILEVISNKKESGGQVYKENDTAIRQGADIAGHLALGLAPGAVNNAWRIGMAAADVKRSTGKPYSLSDEMLALAGFRSSTFDPKVGLYYRTFDFNSAIAEARKELSGVLRDPNKVSDDEISAAKERAKTKQEQAFKQMSRLIKAAQTGGASRRQVMQILLLAGISKRNVGFLLREQVPPVNLSDRSYESAVKRAQLIMDNESAREVRSRFNRIIKND